MFKFGIRLLAGICLLAFVATAGAAPKEASEGARTAAAKKKLSEKPDALCLYVKGLCCPSCAIGIRKKVAKLDFVDRKQFSKGVDLDAKTQLVLIGLKQGETPDNAKLAKAIKDAGYDPVHLYAMKDGQLKTTSIAAKK